MTRAQSSSQCFLSNNSLIFEAIQKCKIPYEMLCEWVELEKQQGRMLDPSAAENQLSSISTFHPVSRIQGTTSTLQPVINGADLDQISMKPPTRASTTVGGQGTIKSNTYELKASTFDCSRHGCTGGACGAPPATRLADSCLFRNFAQRDAQGLSHPFAIGRVRLQAVSDVAELDLLGRIAHGAGSVFKKDLLLHGAHQAEELAGLGVVVVIVFSVIPVIRRPLQFQRRFGEIGLFLPLAVTVGLIPEGAAVVAVHPHGAVAVIAVVRATGGVDRDLVVVDAESVAVSVAVGKEPPLEHLVGRKADARDDVGRVEGRLFDLGEVVSRVFVQLQHAHFD